MLHWCFSIASVFVLKKSASHFKKSQSGEFITKGNTQLEALIFGILPNISDLKIFRIVIQQNSRSKKPTTVWNVKLSSTCIQLLAVILAMMLLYTVIFNVLS